MKTINAHRKALGARLFTLALEWSQGNSLPETQEYRGICIKALGKRRKQVIHGSRSFKVAREAVEEAAEEIREARRGRITRRCIARTGETNPGRMTWRPARPLGLSWGGALPRGNLEQRLERRIQRIILGLARDLYRTDDAGGVNVTLARDPAAVGVRQTTELDWDYYSKRTKYPKKITRTEVSAPWGWLSRVYRPGLAELGGMVTLDALRLEGTPDGIALYAAQWIEQGRGYELRTRRGYIATGVGNHYHAGGPEEAMAGLRRKMGLRKADAVLTDLLAKHGLERIAEAHPDLRVTVSDARSTGSCEPGIQSWCHRTGLPYEAGEAPLIDVYRAYQKAPLPEARAAILHALRRHRRALARAA